MWIKEAVLVELLVIELVDGSEVGATDMGDVAVKKQEENVT